MISRSDGTAIARYNSANEQVELPVYQARIIDQTIVTTDQGDPRLILSVRRTAKLKDGKSLAAGTEPCTPGECEVWLTFSVANETQLRIALTNLKRLGFEDDDVSRLHPDHPNTFNLVGTEVFVRSKTVGEFDYWNLVWPREQASLGRVQQAAASLQSRIDAMRNGRRNETSTPRREAQS
jgi:hypothetical protein